MDPWTAITSLSLLIGLGAGVIGIGAGAIQIIDYVKKAHTDKTEGPLSDPVIKRNGFAARVEHQVIERCAEVQRLNNLPAETTQLFGRENEGTTICDKLLRPEVRLVTLTGPGGVGKTRLGFHVMSELLNHFSDGAYWVDLSVIRDPALVMSVIAQALHIPETSGRTLIQALKDYLRDKHLMLMLDNFEQVSAAAPQLTELLEASGKLKILVTSRMRLNLSGEHIFDVPLLQLPNPQEASSVTALGECASIRLFVQRAQSVRSDFRLTEANAVAVAKICNRLDGLPLALELAAARVRILSPQLLLEHLSSRLDFLTGGARDRPLRHQTLQSTLDWSYDLLDEGHKRFFRRMAPFVGGGTLEALEAVCNYDRDLKLDVLNGAETLLSYNLIQQKEGSYGESRFWMLGTIHEYALEKLQESGEREALEREHALYFMWFSEEAEPHLTRARQQDWLNRLDEEHDNLRAALLWATSNVERTGTSRPTGSQAWVEPNSGTSDSIEIGLRIGGAISRFWYVRGYFSEGREQLERLLSVVSPLTNAAISGGVELNTSLKIDSKSKALVALGTLAYRQGDYAAARITLEEAHSTSRETGDKKSMALALNYLGLTSFIQGDYSAARVLLEDSLAIWKEIGDKWGMALALNNLGGLTLEQGGYAAARSLYEQSLHIQREIGDKWGIAISLNTLGNVFYQQGDYSAARSLYEQSLVVKRAIGEKWGIASSLSNLGIVSQMQDDYATARSLYEQSLVIRLEMGDKWSIAASLSNMGNLSYMQGDYSAARSLYEQSLAIQRDIGNKSGIAGSLAGLGEAAIEIGQSQKGAELLGASQDLLEAIGAVLEVSERIPFERAIASALSQLGEEAFEKAWREGQAMSQEQAIQYALGESIGI